ncbi:MAG: 30S ribosomal protein S4 [Candidatus Paceibacterota bacterium]|jgi:small subunit ribosomal protein S4
MKLGPKFKICRRVGDRVFGKCQGTKFTVSGTEKVRRGGKHPKGQPSEYALQLLEKQKARYTYGLTEKQFSNYAQAVRSRAGGNHEELFFKKLESRLDNIVYRLGLTTSRQASRQMVSHGHIMVNDKKVRIPSILLKAGDKVSIRPASQNKGIFANLGEKLRGHQTPEWLSFDVETSTGVVKGEPVKGQNDATINYSSILEFYSR